jgi:hypothetical protein
MDAFLDGVDLYVDSLDFFALEPRQAVFAACKERGIPAITAAPLGMGAAVLNFLPGRMSFEEYFQLAGQSEQEQLVRFIMGLSPAMLQRGYLVDPTRVNFAEHRGPSTPMACELCAGLAATEAVKILLKRGKVLAAPWGFQVDGYRNRMVKTFRPGGNRHPLQRLGMAIARRQLDRFQRASASVEAEPDGLAERVIAIARWAPSGDNAQPWRFTLPDPEHIVVHGFDTRDHCIYDLQGHASQLALGALLETFSLAGSRLGVRVAAERRMDQSGLTFELTLTEEPGMAEDPLHPYIESRTTQRRPISTRALTQREKEGLTGAMAQDFEVLWFEGVGGRWRMTRLLLESAGLRLALPEAYKTHRDAIDWTSRESNDRIPISAVGFNPMSARLTRWAMRRWERVALLNRLGGSLAARLELDGVPGMLCGAHFVILAPQQPKEIDDYVAAGRNVQRFWLAATGLGLQLQPQTTPLIFHEYVRDQVAFTQVSSLLDKARKVSARLGELMGAETLDRAVFMGRIGDGPAPRFRSTRLSLPELLGPIPATQKL